MLACVLLLFWCFPAHSQSDDETRKNNLRICLQGTYPSLCRRDLLTTSELKQTEETERRHNLSLCLTGMYRSLCRRDLLSQDQLSQVQEAEREVNRLLCDGTSPTLCDKSLLSPSETAAALKAEQSAQSTMDEARRRFAQGMALLQEIRSGKRSPQSLSPEEQQLVGSVVRASRAASRSGANSHASMHATAPDLPRTTRSSSRRLNSCVDSDDFTDDCSSEFRRVRNAHSDYESAVSEVNSYCKG